MASAHGEHLFRRAIIQSAPLAIRTGRQRMTAALATSLPTCRQQKS
jgi:hypothetical protein